MLSPSDLAKEIEIRLKNYLSRDKSGIRRALLDFFLKVKSATIPQIYSVLSGRFDVTYHSVASMVGIISSKFGILTMKKEKDSDLGTYEIKSQYMGIVERVIAAD